MNLIQQFLSTTVGFQDTVPALKEQYPGRPSYKQEDLYSKFVSTQGYDAHNAIGDIKALSQIIDTCLDWDKVFAHGVTAQSSYKVHRYNLQWKQLAGQVKNAIPTSALTEYAAEKIARSGLSFSNLLTAVKREGPSGLRAILSEPDASGKPWVTKTAAIIQKLVDHFVANYPAEAVDSPVPPPSQLSSEPSMATPVRPAADLQLPSSPISPSTLALYQRHRETVKICQIQSISAGLHSHDSH